MLNKSAVAWLALALAVLLSIFFSFQTTFPLPLYVFSSLLDLFFSSLPHTLSLPFSHRGSGAPILYILWVLYLLKFLS